MAAPVLRADQARSRRVSLAPVSSRQQKDPNASRSLRISSATAVAPLRVLSPVPEPVGPWWTSDGPALRALQNVADLTRISIFISAVNGLFPDEGVGDAAAVVGGRGASVPG